MFLTCKFKYEQEENKKNNLRRIPDEEKSHDRISKLSDTNNEIVFSFENSNLLTKEASVYTHHTCTLLNNLSPERIKRYMYLHCCCYHQKQSTIFFNTSFTLKMTVQ